VDSEADETGHDEAGRGDTERDEADRGEAGPGEAGPDEALPDVFWSVARRLRGASREALAPWDITYANLRALRVLSHHGSMRLSELSDHLQIAPRSATEVVDALESRGLVRRRPDPGDRRATLAELTEHGVSVLDAIRAARGSEAERVFGRLTEADRADLARILAKLREQP